MEARAGLSPSNPHGCFSLWVLQVRLVFRSRCKTVVLQHGYVMRLIGEPGFSPEMINAESASLLIFCFPLNPSLLVVISCGLAAASPLPCMQHSVQRSAAALAADIPRAG